MRIYISTCSLQMRKARGVDTMSVMWTQSHTQGTHKCVQLLEGQLINLEFKKCKPNGRYVSSGTFDLFSSGLSWIVCNVCETQTWTISWWLLHVWRSTFKILHWSDWQIDTNITETQFVSITAVVKSKKKNTFYFPRCNRTTTSWYSYIIFYQKIGRILMRLFCDLLKWEPERVIVHLLRRWVKVA